MVDTDDTCKLTVDSIDEGVLTPDQTKKLKVKAGDHILKCVVESVPDLVWRKIVETKMSGQTITLISLKALHVQYDQAITDASQNKIRAAQQEQKATALRQQESQAEAARQAKRQRVRAIQSKINDLREEAEADEEAAQNFDQQAQIMGGPSASMSTMLATQKRQEAQRINLQISELQAQMQEATD